MAKGVKSKSKKVKKLPNYVDFNINVGFFKTSSGVLIGLWDLEGFVGLEKDTMEYLYQQFEIEKLVSDEMVRRRNYAGGN